VVGWGLDEESWSIHYQTIYGDPSSPKVWDDLDVVLARKWEHESGSEMIATATCVDSGGHHTQSVYKYCKAREGRRVFAIKGVGGDGRPLVGRPSKNNIGRVNLFPIGVDTAKHLLFSRFRITEPGAGYCHFPSDRDDEYFKQLTAEKIATRYHKGFARREFVKVRPRNEALDVRVYAMAALTLMNANLKALHNRMMANFDKSEQVNKVAPQMKKVQRGGAFVNRWR